MLEMVQVNRTVNDHQHIEAIQEKSVICNCSSEVGKLWEELSKNRLDMQSMQQKLQMLQTPVKQNEPGKYFFIASVLLSLKLFTVKLTKPWFNTRNIYGMLLCCN